mmetsp:Transcript_21693/g.32049  ORF Transcript_21693/g.32049 Transcript_21693/m.32049 type:complete len:363 (+) Transcript_21693:85-1173(+)
MLRRRSYNNGGKSTLASRFVRLISPKNSDVAAKAIPATDEKSEDRDNEEKFSPTRTASDTSSCSDEAIEKKKVSFAATPDAVQQKIFWEELPVDEIEEANQLLIFEKEDEDDNDSFQDDGEDDYDLDDLSEIMSVSTANTLASLSNLDDEEEEGKLGTIETGKMFFFLQKGPGGSPMNNLVITSDTGPIKKNPGAEELCAQGQIMYKEGEDNLAAGKVKKARKILKKAKRVQREAISLLAKRMAELLYQLARKLSLDGKNAHLATVLFGCCEMLKQNPTPQHILMATKVHLKCRDNKNNNKFQRELDDITRELGNQAKLMALTMKAYATAVNLADERKRKRKIKKSKQKRERRQPETILEDS